MNFAQRARRDTGNKQLQGLRPNSCRCDARDWERMYLPFTTVLVYGSIFFP